MIELGKTGRHFAAARAWCGDDDKTSCGGDIFVLAVAFLADDFRYVGRIAFDCVMLIYRDTEVVEAFDKAVYRGLRLLHGHDDAAYVKPFAFENIDKAEDVGVVGDAQIATVFVLDDIVRADDDEDFGNRTEF